LKIVVWVLRLIGQDPRHFGRNKDIDIVSLTEVDFPTHVKIDYRSVKEIRQGSRCLPCQPGRRRSG
jgi:hypothetical protein